MLNDIIKMIESLISDEDWDGQDLTDKEIKHHAQIIIDQTSHTDGADIWDDVKNYFFC